MLFDIDGFVSRARAIGLTLCGVVMAGTPLLLWVAWSKTVFFMAILTCLLAVVLLGVCLGPDDTPSSKTERAF
jgi:hypothetical protein